MSLMYIFSNTLTNIARAIRWRLGSSCGYYPSEMAEAINRIRVNRLDYMYGVWNNNQFCGNHIRDMQNAFRDHGISGNAVCGFEVWRFTNAFRNCTSLSNAYVGPCVTNMQDAFHGCTGLKGDPVTCDSAIDMRSAYEGCTGLTGNPICGARTVNFASCYKGCSALTGEPDVGWAVDNMYETYDGCLYLGNGNEENPGIGRAVIGPYTNNVVRTYRNCKCLKTAVVGGLSQDYTETYMGCDNLVNIPEIYLDTARRMFKDCRNLKSIPYVSVTNGQEMFAGCRNLEHLSGGYATYGTAMFENCNNLNTEAFVTGYYMDRMYNNAGHIAEDIGVNVETFSNVRYMRSAFGTDSKTASGLFYLEGLSAYDEIKYPDILRQMEDGTRAFAECRKLYLADENSYSSGSLPATIPIGRNTKIITEMYMNTPVYGNFYIWDDLTDFKNCFKGRISPPEAFTPYTLNIICRNYNTLKAIWDEKLLNPNTNNYDSMYIMGTHIAWSYEGTKPTHLWNNTYNVHLYYDPTE